ncbi:MULTISPECIES: hypothetical protein [Corynebacterium]|uniref:DUF4345 domain-containing protein n=1 Tax=Corynebacterium ramonii TaxID=3026968 RepID=A0ABN4EGQ4_9CORY|nr:MULTISPECIES: hypothetical protein [Corynebacterium]AIU32900.1 Hypothetical protein CulFRC11_1331 [Corynebacterium ramonii FRC0011]AKA96870.1 Hypothetical protein CUL131002_1345c [Corynebacterium ulcerans]ESU57729.1 hypothetical protein D881_08040 [Corynebacterium ulcerans NCTC 12077]OAG70188.1 hypothetical protein AFK49_006745 [Corynebacterium ulcerans]STC84673.1 hypothetical membrane protein [Corynebacterium ulcerans]
MSEAKQEPVSASQLAREEKTVSRRVSTDGARAGMLVALVLFLVGLALPHTGGIRGAQLLIPGDYGSVKVAEHIFVYVGTLSVVVLNGLTLLFRRTLAANLCYLLGGISLLVSLFCLWMRLQSKEFQGQTGIGIGLLLEVAATIILVFFLSLIIFARSDEQAKIAQARAEHENLDEVGYAQRSLRIAEQASMPKENPLFIDDRRRLAAAKHKKNQERGADKDNR